jgi:hypothetical protein
MKEEDLHIWIIDTLMEGNYIFQELYSYLVDREYDGISKDKFIEAISNLYEKGYINIEIENKNKIDNYKGKNIKSILEYLIKNHDEHIDDFIFYIFNLSDKGCKFAEQKGLKL